MTMGKSQKRCFLCNNLNKPIQTQELKSTNDLPLIFHRFPSNEKTRSLWMESCHLDESKDNVSNILICSNHFTTDDYIDINARKYGGLMKLKPGAYPTLLVPNSSKPIIHEESHVNCSNMSDVKPEIDHDYGLNTILDIKNETDSETESANSETESAESESKEIYCSEYSVLPSSSHTKPIPNNSTIFHDSPRNMCDSDKSENVEVCSECSVLSTTPIPNNCTIFHNSPRNMCDSDKSESVEICSGCSVLSTTPIPNNSTTIFHSSARNNMLRYPGDLKCADVSTPARAKKCLEIALSKNEVYKKKIKMLQQRNRRLVQKMKSLKTIINELKKKESK